MRAVITIVLCLLYLFLSECSNISSHIIFLTALGLKQVSLDGSRIQPGQPGDNLFLLFFTVELHLSLSIVGFGTISGDKICFSEQKTAFVNFIVHYPGLGIRDQETKSLFK